MTEYKKGRVLKREGRVSEMERGTGSVRKRGRVIVMEEGRGREGGRDCVRERKRE